MKFSVIIPLYNKEKFVLDTIKSVLSQTYTDYEIIVVDDSSTDKSYSIVTSINDSRIKIFQKTNGGVSLARNYGIQKAKGDYVCFLDADDIWDREYLSTVSKYIDSYPMASFFCSTFKVFKDNQRNIIKEIESNTNIDVVDFFETSVQKKGSIALTSAVVIKRELLLSLDYIFIPNISLGEDLDLWTRVALKSKVCYINRPLMYYRSEAQDSLTSSTSSLRKCFPFWEWYSYSKNKFLKKYTTILIYSMARSLYRNDEYGEAINCLLKIKGFYWLHFRIYLYFKSLIKVIIKCNNR